MELRILCTGSSGNCFVIRHQSTLLMVDCGLNLAAVTELLAEDKLTLDDLNGILITHEHSDHASELQAMADATSCPAFLSTGTWQALGCPELPNRQCFDSFCHQPMQINDVHIQPVPVLHDAREPVAWVLHTDHRKIGILTDTGTVSPLLRDSFADANLLALEFNHDRAMLRQGSYSSPLKTRVGGDLGHLNNKQAGQFAAALSWPPQALLIAVHVSENNNSNEHVQQHLQAPALAHVKKLIMAQRKASPWLTV